MRHNPSRREWAPDCILPAVARSAEVCRVCALPIPASETMLRRQWNDITVSHVACGWNCARDRRAVDLNAEAKALYEATKR